MRNEKSMPLSKVIITYGLTQSLPDYCNVRPSITLEYTLEPGDDPYSVRADLIGEARAQVRELADQALEDAGRPARFSTEPRYAVLHSITSNTYDARGQIRPVPPERVVAIVPASSDDLVGSWGYTQGGIYPSDGLRWSHAVRVAEQYIKVHADRGIKYRLIECRAPHDLSFIPRAPEPEPEEQPEEQPEGQTEYMLSEHEPDPSRDEDDE